MMVKNTSIVRPNGYAPINDKFCEAVHLKHPELKDINIRKVLKEFNEYMLAIICEHRDGVLLPHYLGLLFIGVFPGKSNNLTWTLTEGKKNARYSIYDRDGFEARIFYSTIRTRNRYSAGQYWGLKASRIANEIKRDAFIADWKKYIVIPNTRFMNNIVNKSNKMRHIEKKEKEIMKTYNEFDFN